MSNSLIHLSVCILLGFSFLTGCASSGDFKQEIDSVTVGYTTRTEVHALFGEPVFTSDTWPVELYHKATVPPSHAVVVYEKLNRVQAIAEDPNKIEGYLFQMGFNTHHALLAPKTESFVYLSGLLKSTHPTDQCLLLVTTDYTAPTLVDDKFVGRAGYDGVLVIWLSVGLHDIDISYGAWQRRFWEAYERNFEIECLSGDVLVMNVEGSRKNPQISLHRATVEDIRDKRVILHSIYGGR